MVPRTGLEPARPFERYHLKVVRLPFRHLGNQKDWKSKLRNYGGFVQINFIAEVNRRGPLNRILFYSCCFLDLRVVLGEYRWIGQGIGSLRQLF